MGKNIIATKPNTSAMIIPIIETTNPPAIPGPIYASQIFGIKNNITNNFDIYFSLMLLKFFLFLHCHTVILKILIYNFFDF